MVHKSFDFLSLETDDSFENVQTLNEYFDTFGTIIFRSFKKEYLLNYIRKQGTRFKNKHTYVYWPRIFENVNG